jgi:hypothetical protein
MPDLASQSQARSSTAVADQFRTLGCCRLKVPTYEEWLAEEQRLMRHVLQKVKNHTEARVATMAAAMKSPSQTRTGARLD